MTMARIIFSSIVSEVAGGIAGSTLQKSLGGNIIRNKPGKVGRISKYALRRRQAVQFFTQKWRDLTDNERDAWFHPPVLKRNSQVAAKQINLRGLPLFVSCNLNAQIAGGSLIRVPASSYQVQVFDTVAIITAAPPATFRITCAFPSPGSGQVAIASISRCYSKGRAVIEGGFIRSGSLVSAPRAIIAQHAVEEDFTIPIPDADYTARFGSYIPGTIIAASVYCVHPAVGIPGPVAIRAAVVPG